MMKQKQQSKAPSERNGPTKRRGPPRCVKGFPAERLPEDTFLVHYVGGEKSEPASRRARFWIFHGPESGLTECRCDLGGLENAEVNKHYTLRIFGADEIDFD